MLLCESYTNKIDMWGLGVILHELLSTRLPFYAEDDDKFKYNIIKMKLSFKDPNEWADVSKEAKDLVSKLLEKDPSKRIDAT